MPVTIKSGNLKYKNSLGQYVGINCVSDSETADQIADIQAEGATQISAVEAKGEEVRESIPQDYSELSYDVEELKSAFALNEVVTKANAVALTSGADLNDIYGSDKNGVYVISGTVSPYLVNAPRSSGGAYLIVEATTSGNASCAMQTMIYGAGYKYERMKTGTANTTWTQWYNVHDGNFRKDSCPSLAENDNLNDYYGTEKIGIYKITTTVSPTLVNSPRPSGGGFLIVDASAPTSLNTVRQEAVFGFGYHYERYRFETTGTVTWTKWAPIAEDTLGKSKAEGLSSGANLNSYYGADKNGVYSVSSSVSSTLVNAPRSSGGAYLIIEAITPGNATCAKQTMIYGAGYQYIRFKTGTAETTWTKWFNVNAVDSELRKDQVTALASNDDLNDYYGTSGCGIYSFTSAVCATLSNSPRTSGGGYLIIEASTPHNADCVRQEMIFGGGYRYERYMLVSSGVSSWTEWVDLLTDHDATSVSIPLYWKNEIQASIDSVLTNRMAIGENIAEFIFITDTHYSQSQKKSPRLVGYLQKNLLIPDVVFGGDAMYYSGSSKLAGLREMQEFMGAFNYGNLFFTIGNHDFNNYVSSSNILTDSELYATVMKQVERFGTTDGSLDVSYFDNEAHKIRFVQFDYNLASNATAGAAKVLNAFSSLGSDWTVVLFTHKYWQAPDANSGNPPTVISSAKALIQAIIAGSYSATIAAVIVGHVHSDNAVVLDGINVISTTCDCIDTNLYGGPTMTVGTDTEEAFDIVQIDTVNKKLYFTRVGAGEDRVFTYT